MKTAIIGGGAAGFFTAINLAEKAKGKVDITIFEKSSKLLSKVKISGGGRCNVTNGRFDPAEVAAFYPRGSRELLGPFNRFCTGDTFEWFEKRGVELKIEDDLRVFPVTDDSGTIIDCFLQQAGQKRISIKKGEGLKGLSETESGWECLFSGGRREAFDKVVITTGGTASVWKMLEGLGHNIIKPVPSLFTFNVQDKRIRGLQGLAAEVSVSIPEAAMEETGPLLITHWGFSGPAVLRLSAWGARKLHDLNYKFRFLINWTKDYNGEEVSEVLKGEKQSAPRKKVGKTPLFGLPGRLWLSLCDAHDIGKLNWADLSRRSIEKLSNELTASVYQVNGKSTFKEEFVTAGGVDLKEVDMRTMESKILPGVYFAGEVLNIDGITGGFNFQAAWTTGYIAAGNIM